MSASRIFDRDRLADDGRRIHPFVFDAGPCTVEGVLDPYNMRVKLFDAAPEALSHPEAEFLTAGLGETDPLYSKVTVYALSAQQEAWRDQGFRYEGRILGYFRDGDDATVWAAYGDDKRGKDPCAAKHDRIVDIACGKQPALPSLPEGYVSHIGEKRHAGEIAELLSGTFSDYPTPLTAADVGYAIENGLNVFRLVRIESDGALVAAASAEIDRRHMVAELTDCATDPAHRGRGLMGWILSALADEVSSRLGISDLYTIARADETGMNCAFAKLGFRYTGRLVNNCRMPNGWESMNLWCRESRK